MGTDIQAFCMTCERTIANSGGTPKLKEELALIEKGWDKGVRLSFECSKRVRKCMRKGHRVVWERL